MNGRNIQTMAGTLNAHKEHAMIMDATKGMKLAMYGQVRRNEVLEAGLTMSNLLH